MDKTGIYIGVAASLVILCIGGVALFVTARKKCRGQTGLRSIKQIPSKRLGCSDDHVVIVTTNPDVSMVTDFVRTLMADIENLAYIHVLRINKAIKIAKKEVIEFCGQLTEASANSTNCNLRCAHEMKPKKVVLCYALYSYAQYDVIESFVERIINDLHEMKDVVFYNVVALVNINILHTDSVLNKNFTVYKMMDEYSEIIQFIRKALEHNSVYSKPSAERFQECSDTVKINVPNAPLCRLSNFSYGDQNSSSVEDLADQPLLSNFEKKGFLGEPFARRERYVSCDSGHVTSESSCQSSSVDEGHETTSRTSASLGEHAQPEANFLRSDFEHRYDESSFDCERAYISRCPSGFFLPPEPSEFSFSEMDDQVLDSLGGRFNDGELVNFSEKLDTISFITCEGHHGNALKKHVTKYRPEINEVSRRKSLSMESIMNMMAEINRRNDEAFTSERKS